MPSVVPLVRTIVCASGRVDEARGLRARALVERGRPLAQQMRRAMDVGVGVAIVVVHRLEHRRRLLAGVRAVEIDERLAVHALGQDRKVRPDLLHVEARPAPSAAAVVRSWLVRGRPDPDRAA